MNNKIELYKLIYPSFDHGDEIVFIIENNNIYTYTQLLDYFDKIGLTSLDEIKTNTKLIKRVKEILINQLNYKTSFYFYGKFYGAALVLVTDEITEHTFLLGSIKKS